MQVCLGARQMCDTVAEPLLVEIWVPGRWGELTWCQHFHSFLPLLRLVAFKVICHRRMLSHVTAAHTVTAKAARPRQRSFDSLTGWSKPVSQPFEESYTSLLNGVSQSTLVLKEPAFTKGFDSFMSSSAVGRERKLHPRQACGTEDIVVL